MDLALNNLQRLISHKNQPTNQPTYSNKKKVYLMKPFPMTRIDLLQSSMSSFYHGTTSLSSSWYPRCNSPENSNQEGEKVTCFRRHDCAWSLLGQLSRVGERSVVLQAGCDTRPVFKLSKVSLNSEFSFSQTGCLTQAKEPSLLN